MIKGLKNGLIVVLLLGLSSLLIGCDNFDYKSDIQRRYDYNNQTSRKAVCVSPGRLTADMYPYTIQYTEGEVGEDNPWDPVYWNNNTNQMLHEFAKEGLYSETLVGDDNGKPLYRYDFTEAGRQDLEFFNGATYFCFGRIVVDSIERIDNGYNGVGGGDIRMVFFNYHMENLPSWIKNPEIYKFFRQNERKVHGESVRGQHRYSVLSDGELKSHGGENGVYYQ